MKRGYPGLFLLAVYATLVAWLIVMVPLVAIAGPLEDADAALQRRDYTTAIKLFRPLAENGDAVAQRELGGMYFSGTGVPQNYPEAAKWYRRAADQGDVKAKVGLGVIYRGGLGIAKDLKEAAKWYRSAADQGDAASQVSIGLMYFNGEGVPQDYNQAASWYQRAAAQGNETAQSMLGIMYQNGQGVPQDYVLAYMWINLAASQPLPASDPNRYMSDWIKGFAAASRKLDLETRDKLAAKMTPEQIAEGQKLAREWKAKPER